MPWACLLGGSGLGSTWLTTKTSQTIFRNDGAKEIVLAFPGTIDLQHIATDLNFPQTPHPACDGCAVHQGVYETWLSIANNTTTQVKEAQQANPDYQFVIVGHSLGGGLANNAYVDMQRGGIKVDRVVTFGELAVGNQKYADHVDSIAGATDDPSKPGMFMRVTHANGKRQSMKLPSPGRAQRGCSNRLDDFQVLWTGVQSVQYGTGRDCD
ncbi:extracellular lipase [Apiospora saccharicola]|uniref:Extracellular lipase n=1 Tax=Apiospora saccharicola TaxID=335842 RepID=A0ABR1TKG1_9PEZI